MENIEAEIIMGQIYVIKNTLNNKIHIGSTKQTLHKRMAKHRHDAKHCGKMLIHQEMNRLGIDNFFIEHLESFEYRNLQQLRKREGDIIAEQQAELNERKAGRNTQEYYIDKKDIFKQRYFNNIDTIKARDKERYERDKDKINQRKKKHRETHIETYKERDKQYYYENKDKRLQNHKAYVEANPEKMKDYYHQYYLKNREKKQEYNRLRYNQLKLEKEANKALD